MNITDNFLDKETYQHIKNILLGSDIAWYVQAGKTSASVDDKQLTHLFYSNNRPNSEFFELLNPIREKLKVSSILREKANLTFYNNGQDDIFHIDFAEIKSAKTSIFYLTDRGATIFIINGKEKKVEAKENRMVTFDCNTFHKAVTHKVGDPFRVVINFNYYKVE